MLKMNDVSKIYRTELVETHALRNVNLEIQEGEFVSVTGPSGSGKTTFLNLTEKRRMYLHLAQVFVRCALIRHSAR